MDVLLFSGAGDEARTRYLHLGKVALYRMSYTRRGWCLRSELNQRHADFQSAALPTELQRHVLDQSRSSGLNLATPNGLEPSTSSVTGWRANRLHHRAISVPLYLSDEMNYTRPIPICQHLFSYFRKNPLTRMHQGIFAIRFSPSRRRGSCRFPPSGLPCSKDHRRPRRYTSR